MLKKTIIALATFSFFSLGAFADITIINNSDDYGTGYLNSSPCSSFAGNMGIIKPHTIFSVSGSTLKLFCRKASCDAHFYASKNCTGSEIASAALSPETGVVSINNLDPAHYVITGGGGEIKIDPVKENIWSRIKNIFS